ncbi:MAG: hypothetical protein ACKO3P_08290 [Planctomycetaceae bacterium]
MGIDTRTTGADLNGPARYHPRPMETTLHRQLKALYAGTPGEQEVARDGFRIDATCQGELIEIQQASLGALRAKIRRLLVAHSVTIVKPLAQTKRIVSRPGPAAPLKSRNSPLHQGWLHLFDDLVHFVDVFPHPRLTLEVVLTEQEELREPRQARARRRRFSRTYHVCDRRLTAVLERRAIRTPADLGAFLPAGRPREFTTADLAQLGEIPRWLGQRIAYCLRETGAARQVGKRGNAGLYSLTSRRRRRPAPAGPAPNPGSPPPSHKAASPRASTAPQRTAGRGKTTAAINHIAAR